MAGQIKHKFRIIALREFGKLHGTFIAREAKDYLNSYKNGSGRPHRFTQSNVNQIGNLLQQLPDFEVYQKKVNHTTIWKYIGSEEE